MKANDKQVGGEHYAKGGETMQHWDYAVRALGNRYLEGNLTKYVMRSRFKGQAVRDLHKARHYAEKLIECHQQGDIFALIKPQDETFDIDKMCEVNELNSVERSIVFQVASWRYETHLIKVIAWIDELTYEAIRVQRIADGVKAGARGPIAHPQNRRTDGQPSS